MFSVSQSKSTTSLAVIPVAHEWVPVKGTYIGLKKCCQCKKYLIYYSMKKEEIFVCEVCGVRVHVSCVEHTPNNCLVTIQYVGGLLQKAIISSNKKRWDPSFPSASTPQSPVSLKNVNTSSKYRFDEDDDEERLMTWEDVTIRSKDIIVKRKIGEGRFGVVHYGIYHGDAAIKFVNMNYLEESRRYEAFRTEVVTSYKNSRHNNISLFLGYFADPANDVYAIVTNFYHGNTLYRRIHESNDEFEFSWIAAVTLQICQAMSYLHKKKIIHKDLRSKNILLDKFGKVFVADFGLLSLEKLSFPKRSYTLLIPNYWLDYIPTEIATNLFLSEEKDDILHTVLPFTCQSDVYSFGTIFYELLMRKMPTGNSPWEVKMFEKVNGTKAALNRLESHTKGIELRISQILMGCWSNEPQNRPSFPTVVKALSHIVKKNESASRNSFRCFESAF